MDNISSEVSVDSKEQPHVSTSNSNISVTSEDGVWVFKKRQESEEEVIFFNTDYFKRIGFPDAEVSIVKIKKSETMKGGYYNKPEELTYPFRQFVYLIQREKKPLVKNETSSKEPLEPSEYNPNFFERLGNYGLQISEGVQSGIDRISPYFKTTPENLTEEEKQKLREEDENKKALIEENENEKRKKDDEEKQSGNFDKDNYWVVRIPIIKDDSFVPKNKYDNEEDVLKYLKIESNVDKKLGKSKVGKIYDVGSRKVRMCESLKEYELLKIESSSLPGSEMSKWKKFTTSNK